MARRVDRSLLVMSLLIAGGLVLIVLAFSTAVTGDKAVGITDSAVEAVYPQPGALVLRQSEIRADLAPGYRGVLIVDGQEIPTFDLVATDGTASSGATFDAVFDPAQNTVSFTPRSGATIEVLSPGRHTATAVFWKLDESRDSARSMTWNFSVS
jgi:hypothetical protein